MIVGLGEEQVPTVVSYEEVMDVLEDRDGAFMTPEEGFVEGYAAEEGPEA